MTTTGTEYLVMEVLAGRYRLGFHDWPFHTHTATTKALKSLEAKGWLSYRSWVTEKTWLVTLTDEGRKAWKLDQPPKGDTPMAVPHEYSLSLLPEDHIDWQQFSIQVKWRGRDLWGVYNLGRVLHRDGTWTFNEPGNSSRTDEWLADHRFPLGEALQRAQKALPSITWNRWTAQQVLADGADL